MTAANGPGQADPPAPAAAGWRPETAVAIGAVRDALAAARSGVGPEGVSRKAGRDVVTTADVAIEDAVRARLRESLGAEVVGEERGGRPPAGGKPYWLVDPICGTRNFASGIPLYCVNLALVEDGQVAASVVGDGSAGEICVAERGAGAWGLRDGGPRRLSASPDSLTVVIEPGSGGGERRALAARCWSAALLADQWDLRLFSTTLALPYLAAGRVAGFAVFSVQPLHAAAGVLLAREAGAVVSDLHGQPWTPRSDSLVAGADAGLHAELLALAAGPPPDGPGGPG